MDKAIVKRLDDNLTSLCLSGMRREYGPCAASARQETFTYERYLYELTRIECENRLDRRKERWLKESNLPLEKNLASFDLKRLPLKVRQQFQILREGVFLDHQENLLVFGNPGSGKTHLVCALAQELIQKDKRVYFSTCALLLQELLAVKRDLRLRQFIKKLNRYHALIIDDIGYVHQNQEEMEVLFTLLAQRYERGSVIITSNLPFSGWERIFKDPVMTAAAIDRLIHHSMILELNVPSYRAGTARKRTQGEA